MGERLLWRHPLGGTRADRTIVRLDRDRAYEPARAAFFGPPSLALDSTDESDSVVSSASLESPAGISASLSTTDAADLLTAAAASGASAALVSADANDPIAASASPAVGASLSTTDAADLLTAAAASGASAALVSADASDPIAASASPAIGAALSTPDAADLLTAAAANGAIAGLATSDTSDALSATAESAATGAALDTLDPSDALGALATGAIAGVLERIDEPDHVFAEATIHPLPAPWSSILFYAHPSVAALSAIDANDMLAAFSRSRRRRRFATVVI
jgi:hypothetical protein